MSLKQEIVLVECCCEEDFTAAWPVIRQLRDHIDLNEYLRRLNNARENGYRMYIARIDKHAVAAIGYRIQEDLCWGRSLYVDDLVVDEPLRSRGIGGELMRQAEQFAHEAKCNYVRLASGITRTRAHNFYKRIGYRESSNAFAKPICKAACQAS